MNDAVIMALALVWLLLLLRNELTFRANMRAINEAHQAVQAAFAAGDCDVPFTEWCDSIGAPGFATLLDLTRWTYEDLVPNRPWESYARAER